jgi:hypothetical protein
VATAAALPVPEPTAPAGKTGMIVGIVVAIVAAAALGYAILR